VLANGSVNILFTLALACVLLEARGRWYFWAGALIVAPLVEFGLAGVLLPVACVAALRRGGLWWSAPVVLAVACNWPWAAAPLGALGLGVPWLVERLNLGVHRVRGLGWYVYTVHLIGFSALALALRP
jgi:hypothetical protein